MKAISSLMIIMPILLGTIGCASSYRSVLVSVADSATREPLQGAKVTTSYAGHSGFLFTSPHPSEAVTDKNGMALLSASFSPISPDYHVHVFNDKYSVDLTAFGSLEHDKPLRARSKTFIPTIPDVLITVPDRAEMESQRPEWEKDPAAWEKHRAEAERQRLLEEQQAEELLEKSPDYWPEHKAGGHPWVNNNVGRLLLSKRWEKASKKPLGTKADIVAIRAAVIQHMKMPRAKVREIGWLSPSLVMVSSGLYETPLAVVGYTYVLQKGTGGWIVLAYYLEFVS